MPEVGFPELILIAIVGLLVIGPERLPETLRTLGLWFGRMRRSFNTVKAEIEKEIGMDEVKRQLHNEAIMEEMKRIEAEVKKTADTARSSLNEGIDAAQPTIPSIDPNAEDEPGVGHRLLDPSPDPADLCGRSAELPDHRHGPARERTHGSHHPRQPQRLPEPHRRPHGPPGIRNRGTVR